MQNLTTKRYSEMTQSEYQIINRAAQEIEFTPFAKFHIALRGYDLYRKGVKVNKFEVWNSGYRDVNQIINGDKFIVIKKEWNGASRNWMPI